MPCVPCRAISFSPGTYDKPRMHDDFAHPIACRQTISQPYIVALMTECLGLTGGENVLEIGAGSGYQSAVLSLLCRRVVAIERHADAGARARGGFWRNPGNRERRNSTSPTARTATRPMRPMTPILVAAAAPAVFRPLWLQSARAGRTPDSPGRAGGRDAAADACHEGRGRGGRREYSVVADVAFVPLVGSAGYGLAGRFGDGGYLTH